MTKQDPQDNEDEDEDDEDETPRRAPKLLTNPGDRDNSATKEIDYDKVVAGFSPRII